MKEKVFRIEKNLHGQSQRLISVYSVSSVRLVEPFFRSIDFLVMFMELTGYGFCNSRCMSSSREMKLISRERVKLCVREK